MDETCDSRDETNYPVCRRMGPRSNRRQTRPNSSANDLHASVRYDFHARAELNTFTTALIKITALEGYLLLNKLFKFGFVCVVKRNKNKLARSIVSKCCDDTFRRRKKNNGHFAKNRRKLWTRKTQNVPETKITVEPIAIV